MKQRTDSLALDYAVVAGMLLGMAGLVTCLLVEDLGFLAIPASILLLPCLVYGTR